MRGFALLLLVGLGPGLVDTAALELAFSDGFQTYPAGPISSVVGAHTEYHYVREAAPRGPWEASTFRSDPASQRAWHIVEEAGEKVLANTFENKMKHTKPIAVAGNPLWRDYVLEARIKPESERRTGVIVRYVNDRCHYFFGLDSGKVVLLRVNHEKAFRVMNEEVLAEAPFTAQPGQWLEARVEVSGSQLQAAFTGGPTLTAEDATFPEGRVAVLADGRARFGQVRVLATAAELARVAQAETARAEEVRALQAANPQPVVWKKIKTEGFGVGRNVRFGDLNNDGHIDVLIGQVLHHGPKDTNSEISCLTAMTLEGERLWQVGEPDLWKDHLTNDVAFQIHDLDGDGKTEVVYTRGMELIVANGATGETLRKVPTPDMAAGTRVPYEKFPRILGDSLFFCDLRGTGRDADIILKDRYLSLWAFDQDLNMLWHAQCNTGHYPHAADIDGDGRDELMMGYTLFDDDGKVLWTLDKEIQDHADGVALYRPEPERPWRLLCAASDEGLFYTDLQGNMLKHHRLGHVQNPAVADFRPDLPGLEAVSVNFWGNQGIIHFFDADGEILHHFEPFQHGSMCLPVNWSGTGEELVVLSANTETGGMFDAYGRVAVAFPADGHPDLAYDVLDITGDCRDEVVVWNPYEMWVYTQADSPRAGKLYKPTRNPLYNASNYLTMVSLPGWSE